MYNFSTVSECFPIRNNNRKKNKDMALLDFEFLKSIFMMLLHNVKQHNVNVTSHNVTNCSGTQRKSSKT
jgi:hypothetical protein